METTPQDPGRQDDQPPRTCTVNMKFNFAIGVVALVLAALIGWLVLR
jgi:hypothetical protein